MRVASPAITKLVGWLVSWLVDYKYDHKNWRNDILKDTTHKNLIFHVFHITLMNFQRRMF